MEQVLADDELSQGDTLSEPDNRGSDDMPRRECLALDRQVWDFPLSKTQLKNRLFLMMDLEREDVEVQLEQASEENMALKERYTEEKRCRIAAEEEVQRVTEKAEELRKETLQSSAAAAVVFRECLEKLTVDRPDLPPDVKEASEKLRFLRLPGEGPELESKGGVHPGRSSSSTDPIAHEEEELPLSSSFVQYTEELRKALDRGQVSQCDGKSKRSSGKVAPRLSAGRRTGEQMPAREAQSFTGSFTGKVQGVFAELFTGWSNDANPPDLEEE